MTGDWSLLRCRFSCSHRGFNLIQVVHWEHQKGHPSDFLLRSPCTRGIPCPFLRAQHRGWCCWRWRRSSQPDVGSYPGWHWTILSHTRISVSLSLSCIILSGSIQIFLSSQVLGLVPSKISGPTWQVIGRCRDMEFNLCPLMAFYSQAGLWLRKKSTRVQHSMEWTYWFISYSGIIAVEQMKIRTWSEDQGIQLLNRCPAGLHLLINGWQTDQGW